MGAASMVCGLILAAFLIGEPPRSVTELLLNALLVFAAPVVIAGVWGASMGVKILEPAATRGAGRAALTGLAVAGASFVSYLFIVSVCLAGAGDFRQDFLKLFILLLVYGTIMAGWLLGIAGALAGALLYKRVENERVSAGSAGDKV